MFLSRLLKPLNIALVLVVLAVAAGGYAFAATNTVPATQAGAGSNTISGYTISNVVYGLDSVNPSELDSVTFDVAGGTPNTVKVQVVSTGNWYDCTAGTAPSWSCTITDTVTVESMDQLSVVATGS